MFINSEGKTGRFITLVEDMKLGRKDAMMNDKTSIPKAMGRWPK